MSVGAHELQCRFTLFMPRPVSWRLGAQLTGMVGCLPPAAVGKPLEKRLGDRAVAFSVGFVEHPVITRGWQTAAVRSGYLRAALAGVETYWIPDHLNSLVPRSIAVPKYVGLARLVPDVDVACEPWTLLGQVAGWNRIGRLRLGVAVTDGGRRNPAVTAQAAATLHLMSRGRAILGIGVGEREGNELTVSTGVNRSHDSKRRWQPSERCGIPAASWCRAIRSSFLFAKHSSRCRPIAVNTRRSGSPHTGRGCCTSPVVSLKPKLMK